MTMRYSEMLKANAPAERARRMPLLDDNLYPPRQIVRQGSYNGYKPTRFTRRVYVAWGCTVESANGWHRGIVTRDGLEIERLKAVRDRTLAGKQAYAAMQVLKVSRG
jgi:hypothetical protein